MRAKVRKTNIRGSETICKDERIKDVLAQLGSAVPGLEVRDHWEADLCAVGRAAASAPGLLVYVSCWKRRQGQVDYTIDVDETEVEAADDVPVAELIAALARRLG